MFQKTVAQKRSVLKCRKFYTAHLEAKKKPPENRRQLLIINY